MTYIPYGKAASYFTTGDLGPQGPYLAVRPCNNPRFHGLTIN
ncbi:MAG: hypothetical protein AAF502_19095 [Bacteroidota bacterium]